jgi:hypothetical protein
MLLKVFLIIGLIMDLAIDVGLANPVASPPVYNQAQKELITSLQPALPLERDEILEGQIRQLILEALSAALQSTNHKNIDEFDLSDKNFSRSQSELQQDRPSILHTPVATAQGISALFRMDQSKQVLYQLPIDMTLFWTDKKQREHGAGLRVEFWDDPGIQGETKTHQLRIGIVMLWLQTQRKPQIKIAHKLNPPISREKSVSHASRPPEAVKPNE